jgi:NodT family efflux transporter outer membrane factor (OMF) lipoprotein
MMAGFCCAASGCVPALQNPAAREPKKLVPATFSATQTAAGDSAQASSAAQQTWQQFFASAELRALIETALVNNQELNIRLQELVIAHNEISARRGEYLPRLGGTLGAGIEKVGRYTSQGASDDASRLPQNLGNFTFGLVGSWQADIWSKLHNATKAAELRYAASSEGQRFLVTQIVAEIARSYYELIAIDNQLEILHKNIRLQEDTLGLVKAEKQAARVTELGVQRFQADLFRYQSRVYEFEQERVQVENRINFLMGRYPQPIKRNPADFQQQSPESVQAGLPTQLLENRTDVRQAEAALKAAKLDVQVAKAAFYPAVTLDAAVGYRAFNATHLITTPASLIYDAAGGLVAPLLNRKAIMAQYESANAAQIQAVFSYESTMLRSFTDVANQLAAAENWRNRYGFLAKEVEILSQAVEVSRVLFQAARAEYIEVLTTRRDFLEAQMELVEANKRRFLATINIYQALGGGWRAESTQNVSASR